MNDLMVGALLMLAFLGLCIIPAVIAGIFFRGGE